MNRKFNWIFFDLDGTLADSIPAMYEVYISFLSKFGIKGTKEEFEELNGPSLSEIVDILRTRHRLDSDKYFLIDLYKSEILDAYKNYVKPLDGSNDVLQELKKANISSKAVAVIEDSPNGIKSAKGMGVFVIGLSNNHSKEELLESGANIAISQLKEILLILEVKE